MASYFPFLIPTLITPAIRNYDLFLFVYVFFFILITFSEVLAIAFLSYYIIHIPQSGGIKITIQLQFLFLQT